LPHSECHFTRGNFYIPESFLITENLGVLASTGLHYMLPSTHKTARILRERGWPLTEAAQLRSDELWMEMYLNKDIIQMIADAKQNQQEISWALKPPRAHQKEAINVLMKVPYAYLAADCGLGKTYIIINMVKGLKLEGKPCKTLVLCPKSLVGGVWGPEVEEWAPDLKFVNLRDFKKKDIVPEDGDIYAINYDMVWRDQWVDRLGEMNWDILVLDEATRVKTHTSNAAKAVKQLSEGIPKRIPMSGSPMPNGLNDLWHQYYIMDNGVTLSNHYITYRDVTQNEVHLPADGGRRRFDLTIYKDKRGALPVIKDRIAPVTLRYEKLKCMDLPEQLFIRRYFTLSKEQLDAYADLREQYITFLEDGGIITTPSINSEIGKLLQICGGFIIDSEDKTVVHSFKPNPKMELLKDCLLETEGPVLIWAWHRCEVEALAKELDCPYVYGGMNDKLAARNIAAFKRGEIDYLIANQASMGHGHTFIKGNYMYYYSQQHNYEYRHQTGERVNRWGNDKICYATDLIAKGKMDEVVLNALMTKQSNQNFVINPRDIYYGDM
jgi:superfamily II DNA or RNA helicase